LITLNDLQSGNYYLSNPVNDNLYLSPSNKDFWTDQELAKGITLFIPAQERVLLLVTTTKPTKISITENQKQMAEVFRNRRTQDEQELQKATERKKISGPEYIKRNKYLDAVADKCFPIDISRVCNMGFEDDVAGN